MDDILVSVIVPIYNVEKYLDRCLSSIVAQTHKNLEIILVDDGSPDNCPELCEQWAQRDSRIKVIHKQNAGLGMARNTGLDHATGDYIYFIDSDDYMTHELVEHALALAEKEQADAVVFGRYDVDRNGKMTAWVPCPDKDSFSGEEILTEFAPAVLGPDPQSVDKGIVLDKSAWSFFYSKKLIDRSNWRFVSERELISEDVYSFLVLCKDINKVAVLRESHYYYCENPTSLTHRYREDRYERIRHFYLECVALCQRMNYPQVLTRRCSEPYVSNLIAAMKQAVSGSETVTLAVQRLKKIVLDDVLQQVLQEKRREKNNLTRGLLFWTMRHKLHTVTYALVKLQLSRGK